MVFAHAPIQTQFTAAVCHDSDVDSTAMQEESPKTTDGFDKVCLPQTMNSEKRPENVLPIV